MGREPYYCSGTPVRGRKVAKTVRYFATALLKGVEYYELSPLDTPIDGAVAGTLTKLLDTFSRSYSNVFYEAFGSPLEVFKAIVEVSRLRGSGVEPLAVRRPYPWTPSPPHVLRPRALSTRTCLTAPPIPP